MKKILALIIVAFVSAILFLPTNIQAADKITINFFTAEGCPHCEKERAFLSELAKNEPVIEVKEYEITKSSENQKLLKDYADRFKISINGTPFTVIGKKYFVGFSESYTPQAIKDAIEFYKKKSFGCRGAC